MPKKTAKKITKPQARSERAPADTEEDGVYVDVKEAVKLTGLTERCIRKWIAKKKLQAHYIACVGGKVASAPPELDKNGKPKKPRQLVRLRKRDVLALVKPGPDIAAAG